MTRILAPALAFVIGCHALLDIDDIEFGEPGAAQGGAGGSTLAEDCTDGSDDDGDGLTDCEDDDCGSFECVEPAPEGWTGPVGFWIGETGTDPPACPVGWSEELHLFDGMVAPPAACGACTCTAPSGGACSMPQTLVFDAPNCSGAPDIVLQPAMPSSCMAFTSAEGTHTAEGEAPVVTAQGSCAPMGDATDVEPISWQRNVVICTRTTGGGCDGGVCARAVEAPMQACLMQTGDAPCPRGYTTRHLVHDGAADERACSDCTCGAAAGGTCSGETHIYSGGSCNGTLLEVVPNTGAGCASFSLPLTQNSFVYQGDGSPRGGSCEAAGGEAIGTATQAGTVTVCCP